jgi:perosamine synthetase
MTKSNNKLALLGGKPIITIPFSHYQGMGPEEVEKVKDVIDSGVLSGFFGSWSDEFWGGSIVKEFEEQWSKRFKVKYSISMNSATSCLVAAMGAIGIGPGDEVIVPPFTMSATAMAPLAYGGIPVFADIEPDTFGLDHEVVLSKINSRTKAIIAVNLFGHPSYLEELSEIAKENNLYLIEDNSQSPLAECNSQLAGSIGDIGIFSLNYHKHIHTGEGGICVSNNENLALKLKLIRNHGENVIDDLNIKDLTNLFCFNYRLTEIAAAIGLIQLKNIDDHVILRENIGRKLTEGILGMAGLKPPMVRTNARHVYYIWALRYDANITGVSRETFSKALSAEGFPNELGYVRPLYLLPIFQKKISMGNEGFPFNLNPDLDYSCGICPVAEQMYEKELIIFEPCAYNLTDTHIDMLIEVIHKVYDNLSELKSYERS